MDEVHRRVASISKVADNNPRRKGPGNDISRLNSSVI